jgi:hypothetical protein
METALRDLLVCMEGRPNGSLAQAHRFHRQMSDALRELGKVWIEAGLQRCTTKYLLFSAKPPPPARGYALCLLNLACSHIGDGWETDTTPEHVAGTLAPDANEPAFFDNVREEIEDFADRLLGTTEPLERSFPDTGDAPALAPEATSANVPGPAGAVLSAPDLARALDNYATTFDTLAGKLNATRNLEQKPQHLWTHARRFAAQAMRTFLAAVNDGLLPFPPQIRWENDKLCIVPFVYDANENGLVNAWKFLACSWVRSKRPRDFLLDAGQRDFPQVKRDAEGRVLGLDGKPIPTRDAEPATQFNGQDLSTFDPVDDLSFLRAMVDDWESTCRALGAMLREAQAPAPGRTAADLPASEVQGPEPATPAATAAAGEAQAPAPGRTDKPGYLNPTDKAILKAVKRKALPGERIAVKVGRDYDYVRKRLALLVRSGKLRKTDNGYRSCV